MTILTATELRTHIETDLPDTALTRLASAAEATIVGVVGVVASQVDYLRGGTRNSYPTRAISSITTIKERDHPDDAQTTLSADDYRLQGKFFIVRLREGTNPRLNWAPEVELAYVPAIDSSLLEVVQINLVKLALVYSGAVRESDGDFDFWHGDYAKQTKAVLMPLTGSVNALGIR